MVGKDLPLLVMEYYLNKLVKLLGGFGSNIVDLAQANASPLQQAPSASPNFRHFGTILALPGFGAALASAQLAGVSEPQSLAVCPNLRTSDLFPSLGVHTFRVIICRYFSSEHGHLISLHFWTQVFS